MIFSKSNTPSGYYVYLYLREDGTPYYVGKGKKKRAWTKYKGEVRPPIVPDRILIVAHKLSEEESFLLETRLISAYGRKDNDTGILRNGTDGGDGVRGYTPSMTKRNNQSELMKKRYEDGIHNFTDELRQSILESGKNLLYGNNDWHRNNTVEQIKNNKHCSQIKKTCEHCNIIVDSANYSRSHGDNCKLFTGLVKTMNYTPRKLLTCEGCNRTMDSSNFKRYGHGENCTKIRY